MELRAVCFAYPARSVNVFSDFSLTVPAGTTAALVGPSGSGKSTVVRSSLSEVTVCARATAAMALVVRAACMWLGAGCSLVSNSGGVLVCCRSACCNDSTTRKPARCCSWFHCVCLPLFPPCPEQRGTDGDRQ